MIVDLRQLYEIVGEKQIVDYAVSAEKLSEIKGHTFARPAEVKGKIVNHAGVVILTFSAEFTLSAVCDRCLAGFERDFRYDFEHVLVRSVNTDNDEYVVTEGDTLDLDELVISDILLQLPSKMLCKDDCKGLCPHCGADLNYNECNCNGQ